MLIKTLPRGNGIFAALRNMQSTQSSNIQSAIDNFTPP